MGKFHRKSLRAIIRTFRWWSVTYGSFKPFKSPLLFWLRTPPFSIWMLLIGLALGAYFVWQIPVNCP